MFRSYEEELEHRLEHDPSPTESDLLKDLENDFDDEYVDKYNRERICFLERSASFNSDRCGQQGAFVKYPNPTKPKRSSSFCSGSASSKNSSRFRQNDQQWGDKKLVNGEEIKKLKKLWKCKSFDEQIETTSESEDCVEVKARKRFSESKKRKLKKDKKVSDKVSSFEALSKGKKTISASTPSNSGKNVSFNFSSENSEEKSKEEVTPKTSLRSKIVSLSPKKIISTKPQDVSINRKQSQSASPNIRKEQEVKEDHFKTSVTKLPILESEEEKLGSLNEKKEIINDETKTNSLDLAQPDSSEINSKITEESPQKIIVDKKEETNLTENVDNKILKKAEKEFSNNSLGKAIHNRKGALQKLYEEGLKKINEKNCSEPATEEKLSPDSESGNPFKELQEIALTNYIVKRPQTLKIKVGFESPAIGQDLDTPPGLANTSEKTLPYYLKSQDSNVINANPKSFASQNSFYSNVKDTFSTGRCENNIEYEKSVELGKNLVKAKENFGKKEEITEKRLNQGQTEEVESQKELVNKSSPKKSLKKLDFSRKTKPPKPDYSNEIREEVEPITPDTDQSEIEEILETFSKELKNSDVNEILSGDESRSRRSPPTLRETAFLPSFFVKCDQMPQLSKEPLAKASSLPMPVAKTRDQVIKTAIMRKEARPNSLPLRNTNYGLPNTSLTLENYVERRKVNYPPSGRISAPLFKEYQSPGYMSGRLSVPVDHERNIIPDRGRSLTRMKALTKVDLENAYNGNFQRNQLRTRSLTRDAYKGYPDSKLDVQRQLIFESNIPKPINNRTGVDLNTGREGSQLLYKSVSPSLKISDNSGGYSASEIEAVFWERLRQKKIKESLREQELLQKTEAGMNNFVRNAPERSTVGPIYQGDSQKTQKEQNGRIYHQHEKVQGGQEPLKKSIEKGSIGEIESKRKKDEKGFSISKIPFFRRKSKSGSKEDSYKRASEDYEDYQGQAIANSSLEDSDTFEAGKKLGFDKTDNVKWASRKGETSPTNAVERQASLESDGLTPNGTGRHPTASRPLPPLPRDSDSGGYGVILRNKENLPSLQQVQKSDYGRLAGAEGHRTPSFHEARSKCKSPSRSMGIIHENELYSNSKLRDSETQFSPKYGCRPQTLSDTESGSEAGEIQRILHGVDKRHYSGGFADGQDDSASGSDGEWGGGDGKGRGALSADIPVAAGIRDDEVRRLGRPAARRDDPRRHTLAGGHHQSSSLTKSMDLEMSSKTQRKKSPLPRGYPPPSSAMLYDDDPGIMSEAETSSTGFRRGGKQRSSLPVVRTPSKTLERPLGLVFLQYRNETKRALLPNEITSIDTVKALFVRSFPKQLTMEYLDSPMVKIYIHDSNKDMFYELEDLRSHLRDIRDRSVLRLFEVSDINDGAGGAVPGGSGLLGLAAWDQDQMYFSEPEFDSEYQHQHVHKSKNSKTAPHLYYMTHSFPPGQNQGSSATLPRGAGSLLRTYSPGVGSVIPSERMKTITPSGPPPSRRVPPSTSTPLGRFYSQERLHSESGYMSSPERGGARGYSSYAPAGGDSYDDPYYAQGYGSRTGSITPVIDEEASDTEGMDDSYHIYGVGVRGSAPGGRAATLRRDFPASAQPFDATRLRVEHMERQLANLTGLVQKALTQTPVASGPRDYLSVPPPRDAFRSSDEPYVRSDVKPPKFGKDKSVSFEKSVSFSDEPPDMSSPKQHSPQHSADSKPAKPAIKSSTLPRTSSQDRDRHKPPPPPKPVSFSSGQYDNRLVENRLVYRDLQLTPEMYNQLRGLQKKAKDLKLEMRTLRRLSTSQAHFIKETIRDTFIKIRAMLLTGGDVSWTIEGDKDRLRLSREEELYKQEMIRLEKDLTELESTVEELRGNVINRKTRVNMTDVEDMALILSKSSKTVAELKVRFPGLQEGIKSLLSAEMDKVVREEKFIKEEPERLENALRRCKKLTGTLVTLKRLASVQEQRLPSSSSTECRLSPTPAETPPVSAAILPNKATVAPTNVLAASGRDDVPANQRAENALDALLDELQTFARPPGGPQSPNSSKKPPSMSEIGRRKGSIDSNNTPLTAALPPASSSLRRLHSYPSSSDDSSPPAQARDFQKPATCPKPPVPERNAELLSQLVNRRVPPPPPPRTSSRSPLASPTSPSLPLRSLPPSQPQMGINTGTLRRNASGRSSTRDYSSKGGDFQTTVEENASNAQATSEAATSTSSSSSCDTVSHEESTKSKESRKEQLEQRHQELLRKQKALQEQYARLQQLQRGTTALSIPAQDLMLKKTGSESNLLSKMGLGQSLSAAASMSGSLTHLASQNQAPLTLLTTTTTTTSFATASTTVATVNPSSAISTTKIYETDIL